MTWSFYIPYKVSHFSVIADVVSLLENMGRTGRILRQIYKNCNAKVNNTVMTAGAGSAF